MKSKLIVLGCGNSTGVPRIDGEWGNCNRKNKKNFRTRCSAIVIKGSNNVLIDTSPDIKKQLLDNRIKKITSILYTHEHADQTNGLFELRPFFWRLKKKINVYGNKKTVSLLKKRFDYCFQNKSFYPAFLKANLIKKEFTLGSGSEKINFQSIEVKHGLVKSIVYVFNKTAYISDCNDLSIINNIRLKKLDYLILDCLKIKDSWAHFNLKEALYVHKNLKPKKTILTNLHEDLDYDFLLKKLPKNVLPAYDGLSINL